MAIIIDDQTTFEDKIRIVDNSITDIENIYDYSLYEYYGMSVSFLDRENHIMYPYVYDNYINVMKKIAKEMLDNTGHEEISLSSLSSSDYSELKELVYFLIDEFKEKKINISLPSLRIDAFSLELMEKLQ